MSKDKWVNEFIQILFSGVAVAVLGRKLYAVGGFDGQDRLNRFVEHLIIICTLFFWDYSCCTNSGL